MEAKEKIYKAFYESGKEWLYFSELKGITNLSNSSLQNVLSKLLKLKQIREDKKTSNIYYKLSNSKKPQIFFSLDSDRLKSLNPGVRVPLNNFLKDLPDEIAFVILFGSSSRKQEKEGSDIDLLVVIYNFLDLKLQSLYEKEIKQKINALRKKINSESNYPLSITYITLDKFKISKDHLILQAKNYGYPIKGGLNYYKKDEED